jgi:hypothetical protein
MTDVERRFEEAIAAWRAAREKEVTDLRLAVHAALSAGGTVRETFGSGVSILWLEQSPFVPSATRDPDYLTDHLMARHVGFGTGLEVVS